MKYTRQSAIVLLIASVAIALFDLVPLPPISEAISPFVAEGEARSPLALVFPEPSPPTQDPLPQAPAPPTGPGEGAPPPLALEPLPQWMAELKARLEGELAAYTGDVAIAFTDLQTDLSFSINGRRRHLAGCTIKMPMLVATLRDVEEGRYPLAVVEKVMLDSVLYRTATDTSNLWLAKVGVRRVNEVMAEIGMPGSLLTHPPFYFWLQEPGYSETENILTAEDINRAFVRLYRGELLGPEMSAYALRVLTNSFPRHRTLIARMLPADATVIHKIGYVYPPPDAIRGIVPPPDTEAYNDAGIVVVKRGERQAAYSLAILTQGNPDHFGEAGPFAARLSRAVYDAFTQAYFAP